MREAPAERQRGGRMSGTYLGMPAFPKAAKVGGLAYRLLMTLSGLVLATLGGLAVWSFWFGKRRPARAAPAIRMRTA